MGRAGGIVVVLVLALITGCSSENNPAPAGSPPADGSPPTGPRAAESGKQRPGPALADALLPTEQLPPGPQYQMRDSVPNLGDLESQLEVVQPPECREMLELLTVAAGEIEEVAAVSGTSEQGFLGIGLLRGDGLVKVAELESQLRRCPRYTVTAGEMQVVSEQQVQPAPALAADAALHYTARLHTPGGPPGITGVEQAAVVLRDGDVQISVNASGAYAGQVVELARAALERKREVLG